MPNNKEEQQRRMIFNGSGQVSVNPDLAILRLGVQTTSDDVSYAQTENARISQEVINSIRQLGINDIKTYDYQIEKLYDYENGQRIDRGYIVKNIFEVRTVELGLVGNIIDTAVEHGANIVESINFDVINPDAYYQQALTNALNNAFQKAKTISSNLRIMFHPTPILIKENSTPPTPFSPMFAAREAYTTPIEPGSKDIKASITVEFAY